MKKQNDFVPEWAKKVVWYQIFPEHFRNGNKYNDPTVETLKGAGPNDYTSPWQVHPWTSDWYKLQPYETTKIIQALITPDGRVIKNCPSGIRMITDWLKGRRNIYLI